MIRDECRNTQEVWDLPARPGPARCQSCQSCQERVLVINSRFLITPVEPVLWFVLLLACGLWSPGKTAALALPRQY